MTRLFIYLFGPILFVQTTSAQSLTNYDDIKISTATELNFALTDKRGIESKIGIVYFVENDLQTLTAYEKGEIKWQTNIKICGKPVVGQSAIRYIKLDDGKISVIFGKHSFASVNISDGNTKYLGAD